MFAQSLHGLEGPFKFGIGGSEGEGSRFEDMGERSVRLASLLPAVARLTGLVLNGMPNEFVEVGVSLLKFGGIGKVLLIKLLIVVGIGRCERIRRIRRDCVWIV